MILGTPAQPVAGKDGVWLIYTGEIVTTCLDGVNDGEPIELVVDLATLTAFAATIPALYEHQTLCGSWTDIGIDPALGITGRLSLLDTSNPADAGLPIIDAARTVRAAQAQGISWQASLGATPGATGVYEQLTAETQINGRLVVPGELPLFVLRGGVLTESSIVLFGADPNTGKIAASRKHPSPTKPSTKESPVSEPTLKQRVDTLTTKLGAQHRARIALAITDGATDDQVVTDVTGEDKKAQDAKCAKLEADLAASNAELADVKAQLAALAPPASGTSTAPNGGTTTTSTQCAAPRNLAVAMQQLAAQTKMTGSALRRAALAKYPMLDPNNSDGAEAKRLRDSAQARLHRA